MVQRYLLFQGEDYYPFGGWYDFKRSFETLDEALAYVSASEDYPVGDVYAGKWWHIVDITTGEKLKTEYDNQLDAGCASNL